MSKETNNKIQTKCAKSNELNESTILIKSKYQTPRNFGQSEFFTTEKP